MIDFDKVDVFAFLDADSTEAKAFTTYLGYWSCLGEIIETSYGEPPYDELFLELQRRRKFRALVSKQARCDAEKLSELLLNAWSSELALYAIDLADTEKVWLENQWTVVKAYYATMRIASAWLLARDGQSPQTHRGLLRALSSQVSDKQVFPQPWSCTCTAVIPSRVFSGFASTPQPIHNLSSGVVPTDRMAMLLGTTRERLVV